MGDANVGMWPVSGAVQFAVDDNIHRERRIPLATLSQIEQTTKPVYHRWVFLPPQTAVVAGATLTQGPSFRIDPFQVVQQRVSACSCNGIDDIMATSD